MGRRRNHEGIAQWIPSGDLIISKGVFENIGGFNPELITGEDTDICNRLLTRDLRIFSSPRIAVVHLGEAKTIRHFFGKQKWHGKGGIQRFVREFPRYVFDKTIIFAVMLQFSVLIAFGAILVKSPSDFTFALVLAGIIPMLMSLKTVVKTGKYKHILQLFFLFLLFGIARAVALCNLRLWVKEIIEKKTGKNSL